MEEDKEGQAQAHCPQTTPALHCLPYLPHPPSSLSNYSKPPRGESSSKGTSTAFKNRLFQFSTSLSVLQGRRKEVRETAKILSMRKGLRIGTRESGVR